MLLGFTPFGCDGVNQAMLELWTPPESDLERTTAKEEEKGLTRARRFVESQPLSPMKTQFSELTERLALSNGCA